MLIVSIDGIVRSLLLLFSIDNVVLAMASIRPICEVCYNFRVLDNKKTHQQAALTDEQCLKKSNDLLQNIGTIIKVNEIDRYEANISQKNFYRRKKVSLFV